MNSPLILDVSLVDWVTLTSFEPEFFRYWYGRFRGNGKDKGDKKILQYEGNLFDLEGGTGFIGRAIQNGRENFMLRLSGYAAEDNKNPCIIQKQSGIARCTRIDLQITTEVTDKWSQFDLLKRLKSSGKMTGYIESKVKGLGYETVYIGSRQSERFLRVYIKQGENPRLLRFEVEYKGNRSDAVLRGMGDGQLAGNYLMHEVQSTVRDKGITMIFEPLLSGSRGYSPRLLAHNSLEKQENWLISQVLPSFTRHINDHNSSGRVELAFMSALRDAIDGR